MKKLLYGVLGLMVFIAFSCKKGERLQRVYLLNEQIIDDRADGLPIDTTRYYYDDQNHLTMVHNGDGHYFTMSYDAAGRVNVAKTINPSGNVAKEFDFFYSPTIGFVTKVASKEPDTAYLTFDDKHEVTEIRTVRTGYSTFTYDARGNVASLKNYDQNGNLDIYDENFYTYDNMKNFFSAVPRDNYFLMYILYPDANSLVNNVVTKNADVYTYTYNTAGYPVSASAKVVGRSLTPIYYNYIVK